MSSENKQVDELLKLLEQLKKDVHDTTFNTGNTRPNSWNSETKQRWEGLIDRSTSKIQDYSKQNDAQSQELKIENSTLHKKIQTLENRLKLLTLISETNDDQVDELITELTNKKFFKDNNDDQDNEGNNGGGQIV